MAFTDTKVAGDLIMSSEQNAFVDFSELISSQRAWSTISGSKDIVWDTTQFDSSGIKWDNTTQKWIAVNVTAAGGGINNVVEDTSPQLGGDLEGNTHGINTVTYVSSQTISGGSIKGTWVGDSIGDTYIDDDITLTNITQITNRSHTNLSNIGSNTHTQIDTHISDNDKHFLSSNITGWLDGVYAPTGATGGITGWQDFSAGTGISSFGGSYSISGGSSLTLSINDYIASANAVERFADSSNINTKINAKQDTLAGSEYYPSSIGAGLSGNFQTHTSNSTIHFTKVSIDDNYAGSSNYSTHRSDGTIHFTKGTLDDDYYPSSLGKGISSQVHLNTLHSSNASIHFTQSNITTVGTIGTGVWEGTTLDEAYIESGSQYQQAYQSSQLLRDLAFKSTYSITGASDIDDGIGGGWNSTRYHHSGIMWDSNDNRWEPMPSGGGGGAGDTSTTLTIATTSGIASTVSVLHDGSAGTLYLNNIPQNILKSGSEYWKAYMSAQVAVYDAGGGISSWYDLSAGTGVTPFGGSVSISGTQAETLSILGYATISSNAQKGHASGVVALYSETYSSESDLTTILNDNYPGSSNVNRALIDTISGALDTKIDAISDTPTSWTTLTAGTGIDTLSNIGVSGSSPETVTVLGYTTISTNAYAGNAFSSNSDLFDSTIYIASSTGIDRFHPSALGDFAYISTQTISGITCDDVKLNILGNATINNVCDYMDNADSSFLLSGGSITLGGPTGSVSISKGLVAIRATNSEHNTLWQADVPASSNMTLSDGAHYIYVDYNSGSPIYQHRTTTPFNGTTQFHLARIYNDWSTGSPPETHIVKGGYRFHNLGKATLQRFGSYGSERSAGLVTASSQASGHPSSLSVTAGTIWRSLNKFSTTAQDHGHSHDITAANTTDNWFSVTGNTTLIPRGNHIKVDDSTGNNGIYIISSTTTPSSAGYKRMYTYQSVGDATVDGHIHDACFTYYWRDGASGWYNRSGAIGLDIDYWDDNTGTLNDLTTNRYGVHWVYSDVEGDISILYGQGDYTLALAEDATTPASTPTSFDITSILIAKIIIQKGEANLVNAEFLTPWETTFAAGNVDSHNDLGGLQGGTASEYYHVNSADYTSLTTTILDNGDASSLHHHKTLYPVSGLVNKSYLDNVSSNATDANNWVIGSGNRYEDLYGSGAKYTQAYDWYSASASRISEYVASGDEYSQAYASAQIALYSDLWTQVGDNIYFSGGKVGIGTHYPSTQLHVLSGASFGKDTLTGTTRGLVNVKLTNDDGLGYIQALKMHANKDGLATLYGFNGTAIGNNTTNIGIYGYAAQGTNNYGIQIASGEAWFYEEMGVGVCPTHDYMLLVKGDISSQALHTPSFEIDSITFTGVGAGDNDIASGSHTHAGLGTDVAWSGASEFYAFSSNVKDDIVSLFSTSSSLDSRIDTLEGADGIGDIIWTAPTAVSGVQLAGVGKLSGAISIGIVDYIASASALAKFAGTGHTHTNMASTWTWNTPTPTSGLSVTGVGKVSGSLGIYIDDYIASSTAIDKFLISSDFFTWRSSVDSTEMGYLNGVTSDIQTQLDSKNSLGDMTWNAPTQASGVVLVGTAGVSGNLKVTLSTIPQDVIKSGANWQKAYLSGQLAVNEATTPLSIAGTIISISQADTSTSGYLSDTDWDTFNNKQDTLTGSEYYPSSLGKQVSSAVLFNTLHSSNSTIHFTQANITTVGTIGTGVWEGDAIGYDYLTLGSVSSNAKSSYDWFTESSQKLSTFYASGDEYSTNYDWYNTNNSQLDNFLASGDEYSGWYGSGAQFGTAYDHSQDNTQAHSDYLLNSGDDTMGGVLTANGFTTTAGISSNVISSNSMHGIAPMTYSLASVRFSAQQNINIIRFKCPTGEKAYIYQACCCNSGGTSTGELYVEMLADSNTALVGVDTVYKTSSNVLQHGNPLASCDAGDYVEIRMMYSGANATGVQFGTGLMQVGVY